MGQPAMTPYLAVAFNLDIWPKSRGVKMISMLHFVNYVIGMPRTSRRLIKYVE